MANNEPAEDRSVRGNTIKPAQIIGSLLEEVSIGNGPDITAIDLGQKTDLSVPGSTNESWDSRGTDTVTINLTGDFSSSPILFLTVSNPQIFTRIESVSDSQAHVDIVNYNDKGISNIRLNYLAIEV